MDSTEQRVGIVVAMHSELIHLLRMVQNQERLPAGPFRVWDVAFSGGKCRAVLAGIGLIDAAAATQRLFDDFSPNLVLNYGCAGAHRDDLRPGDVVVGTHVVNPFAMQIRPDGTFHHMGFVSESDQGSGNLSRIDLDVDVRSRLSLCAHSETVEPWPYALASERQPAVYQGGIASADVWTQYPARIRAIAAEHDTLCEDMEAIAIARICQQWGVPFGSVKDISNSELLRASDLDAFSDFPIDEVGKRAARVVATALAQFSSGARAGIVSA